jgi:heptosyltransferase II
MPKAFPSRSFPSEEPIHWLVRSPNPLGDACMSLPAVRALRAAYPKGRITICTRENLTAFWQSQVEVDHVIGFAKGLSPWQVGKTLRGTGSTFDRGLLLPNSFRSALELRLGGVSRLIGYGRSGRGCLLSQRVAPPVETPERHHLAYRYLHLATAVGADDSRASEWMARPTAPRPITPDQAEWHLGICPGAEYGNAKRYPIERYAEAISLCRARFPEQTIRVSVYGSPAERGIGEELISLIAEPRSNLAGSTSIAGLVDELRTCHLLATNDTGTMHLAAALGIPTVAIFGSTDPTLTAPLGEGHEVVQHKVDCNPCFLRECPIDYRCMLRIEATRVADAMASVLTRPFS